MTTIPAHRPQLAADNITLAKGAGRGIGMTLIVAGLLAAFAVLGMGLSRAAGVTPKHALAVYHVGAMGILAMSLGGLFFTMAFHLTNAGWSATIRRQCENLASFLPFAWLLVLPTLVIEIANHGLLFAWMNPVYYADHALQVKSAFFYLPNHIVDHDTHTPVTTPDFPAFFVARAVIYGVVWTLLSRRLCALSKGQDAAPSVELAAKARFTSAYGMLLFAI